MAFSKKRNLSAMSLKLLLPKVLRYEKSMDDPVIRPKIELLASDIDFLPSPVRLDQSSAINKRQI